MSACGAFGAAAPVADGGSDGGGAAVEGGADAALCAPLTCAGRPACRVLGCSDYEPDGDLDAGTATSWSCVDSRLEISARSTLDIYANATVDTPELSYSTAIVSLRAAVKSWPANDVFNIQIANRMAVSVFAIREVNQTITFAICRTNDAASCGKASTYRTTAAATTFTFRFTPSSISILADCEEVLPNLPGVPLPRSEGVHISIGGPSDDGNISAVFENVIVAFE